MRRALSRGDIITVIVPRYLPPRRTTIHLALVKKPGVEIRCVYRESVMDDLGMRRHNFHVRRKDEGVTWARGTTGPEVDALKVVNALS